MYFPAVRVFDDIIGDFDRLFDRKFDASVWDSRKYDSPYHVTSDADGCVISIDIPGVAKEDIFAQVEGNVLEVSGKKKNKEFVYRYSVDKRYDVSTVTAKSQDGVLSFSFKLKDSEKPRKIVIE